MSDVDMEKCEALLRVLMETLIVATRRIKSSKQDVMFTVEMLREAMLNELLLDGLSPAEVEDVATRARMHAQEFFREDGAVQ